MFLSRYEDYYCEVAGSQGALQITIFPVELGVGCSPVNCQLKLNLIVRACQIEASFLQRIIGKNN